MSKHAIEVASAIIQRDGKYLIAQRLAGSYLGPLWEFPGGKRESDESLEDCVAREVAEKLDIQVQVDKQWRTVELNYPERTVRLHFYLCSIESGKPRSIGCQHFRWITPLEFDNYEFPPADQDIVDELARKALRPTAARA
ncbi:MAG: (deoxy)nucleoside triphosphate pyrophosphohydrolase [Candidatus Eiseniibacteriota bacterium]|jgi:mutator protein MutT